MRDWWGNLFGMFFGIVGIADFLSVLILYRMPSIGKVLVLKAFPVGYWIIKVGEMGIAFSYLILYLVGSYNRRKTLTLLAFLFVVFRLLSNVPLLGNVTKITSGSIISSLIMCIAGMATMYNLRGC